jgi:hypothetical protein
MADDEPKPPGAGRRTVPADPPEAAPLSDVERAERALATQGKAPTLVESLTEAQRAALAATLDENDLATEDELDENGVVVVPGTARVVTEVLREFQETNKAVVDDLVNDNE